MMEPVDLGAGLLWVSEASKRLSPQGFQASVETWFRDQTCPIPEDRLR